MTSYKLSPGPGGIDVVLELGDGHDVKLDDPTSAAVKIDIARRLLQGTGFKVSKELDLTDDNVQQAGKPGVTQIADRKAPYRAMSDDALVKERIRLENGIEDASGFVVAKEYAKDLKHVCAVANERGLGFVNKFPIVRGRA